MREFSKPEEKIIRKMVDIKDFRDLSLAKLIDENTSSLAMEWDESRTSFQFYYRGTEKSSEEIFDEIAEIIYLLKILEDEKYIFTHKLKQSEEDNMLFNRRKYKVENQQHGKIFTITLGNKIEGYLTNSMVINTDFGKLVEHFAGSLVHITFPLKELVDNNFKSPEQRRFEKQLEVTETNHKVVMKKAQKQEYIAWGAFGISLITLLVTFGFGIWEKCSETKIYQSQFNQLKQTIEQKAMPEVFKTEITNDTLTSKVVEMPKVKSNR